MTVDCIVVLGGPAWEDSANQTSMQCARALSGQLPVVYVSRSDPRPIKQRLSEMKRGRQRQRRAAGYSGDAAGALHILRLPRWTDWVPLVRLEWARRILKIVILRSIRKEMQKRHLSRPGLIAYWWMFPELVAERDWQYRVFDVIDRHWGYEYLSGDAEVAQNLSLAVATAQASDRVVAVSKSLAEEVATAAAIEVEELPNAVDVARVARVLRETGQADQERNGRRAVYVGGWNERVDFDLFERVTHALPDWHFIVIGAEVRLARPNVEFLGDLAYEDAIRAMATASVGLLPFRDTKYTRASSFLKAFDYLAAGLTVLTTPLPAMSHLAEMYPRRILVADGADWHSTLRGNQWVAKAPPSLSGLPDTRNRFATVLTALDPDLAARLRTEDGFPR